MRHLVRTIFGRAPGDPPPPAVRRVWLTFDDGPEPTFTPLVLDVLRRHRIKVTFFLLGDMVRRFGDVVPMIAADGHRIGNHSFLHPDLTTLDDAAIADEVLRTEEQIARYTVPDKIFRPPYGFRDERVDSVVSGLGYRMVLYDLEPGNLGPPYPEGKWVRTALDHVYGAASSVIVLHDIHRPTAPTLDRFIRRLKRIGNVAFESPSSL